MHLWGQDASLCLPVSYGIVTVRNLCWIRKWLNATSPFVALCSYYLAFTARDWLCQDLCDCGTWARSWNEMMFVAVRATHRGQGRNMQEEILKSLQRDFCKYIRISCMSWCFCGMGDVAVVLGRKGSSQLQFLQWMPLSDLPEWKFKPGRSALPRKKASSRRIDLFGSLF